MSAILSVIYNCGNHWWTYQWMFKWPENYRDLKKKFIKLGRNNKIVARWKFIDDFWGVLIFYLESLKNTDEFTNDIKNCYWRVSSKASLQNLSFSSRASRKLGQAPFSSSSSLVRVGLPSQSGGESNRFVHVLSQHAQTIIGGAKPV